MTEPVQEALGVSTRERTDPLLGEQLGPYRIQRVLGAGGMGVVYLALDVALQRPAAVKVVSPLTPRGVRRFIEEARRQARLDHPNIVSVYGAGSELVRGDVTHYIAMQYVEGPSLAELVRRHGPLDPVDATSFVLDAARGLYFVHAEGFIHRDVKPGNVLIDAADRALVADFGVAGDVAAAEDPPTGGGEFLGTRAYASPEQLAGGRVDVRSDVFSLGATWLFALTAHEPTNTGPTGRLPIDPALPPLLRATLQRMVETDPNARFSSMLECIDALEKTLASLERGSRAPLVRPSRRARRRGMRGYMVFALALGGLVGGFALVGPDSSIPRERATSRRPSPPRVSAPVAAPRSDAPPATPGAPLVESPTTDVPSDEGGIVPGAEGDAGEGPDAAARASAPRGEDPAPPELDALALAAEVEAWGAVARDVPGLVPPRLVELETLALADAGEDAALLPVRRACDRVAIELASAWSPAFDAATVEVLGLEIDLHPLTHAQYFEFLRGAVAADPSLFLTPLRPTDDEWVSFADERKIRRPRIASLARPIVGLPARAAEAVADARGQRIPERDEWRTAIAPLHAATTDGSAPYERVAWGDVHHFAAVVGGAVVLRDGLLPRHQQGLRLVR